MPCPRRGRNIRWQPIQSLTDRTGNHVGIGFDAGEQRSTFLRPRGGDAAHGRDDRSELLDVLYLRDDLE
jgi:hypothetical protein